MRAPTSEEKESMYWWSNESWYRINKEKDCFELTDEAPEEARESFELYCKIQRRYE